MRRSFDNQAVSPIVGFIIATVLFSASFYYVMDTAVQQDPKRDQAFEYTSVANTLADIIIGAGTNWYAAGACLPSGTTGVLTPEEVGRLTSGVPTGRFGLGDENCGKSVTDAGARNNLSFEKFRNVYQSKMTADSLNGKVDYQEARRSLGLTGQNLDFHVRTWPVLASVREILGTGVKDPLMRPAYIGNYGSTGGGSFLAPTTTVEDNPNNVKIIINPSNNGLSDTMFTVVVTLKLQSGDVSFNIHTTSVPTGQPRSIEFVLPKTSDWDWKGQNEVNYQVWDKNTKLWPSGNGFATIPVEEADGDDIDMTLCSGVACPLRRLILAEADRMYFTATTGSATVEYHHQAFTGAGVAVSVDLDAWEFRLRDQNNVVVYTDELTTTSSGSLTKTITGLPDPVSFTYRAELSNDAFTETFNTVNVNLVTAAPSAYVPGSGASTYQPEQSVITEIRYLDLLIDNYDPYVVNNAYAHVNVPYDPGALGIGDVFPDLRDAMNNDLKTALTDGAGNPSIAKYTTLFVGSNVDHNAMTSQQAKGAIRDWVFAGGTLIVMGSNDQSVTWLQPIFHASLESGSGGIYTPDQTHASLNVPNQLDYTTYGYGPSWGYNAGEGDSFTHVVQEGSGPAANDILGIGNPGAFGLGKVILTAWRPYALTTDQSTACANPSDPASNCQAMFMIHNLVTLSYRELYLDYGPAIPVGEPTGAQLRVGSVYHPDLKQLIGVQLQVFVFPGGG